MSFSKILSFFSDPASMTALGITLMLMLMGFIYYYFYSTPSSSNSSETKKEKSSSNSSEPKKEDSSSNSSEPKKEILSSNSSEPKKEESSSNSSETKKEKSSSNSSKPKKEISSSNSSEPKKEISSSNSSKPKKEISSSNSSEPKKEISSSNSFEPKKEESSSNSSEPKIMVSTSTSSIKNSFKYDVFVSFTGEDTRKNFVDHLYHALKDKGIYTYKDDVKIHKGKRISDDLFESIEDSKFYIIVFSKNYASSSWCLEELVKIIEWAVGEAFAKHENEEAVGKWREALQEAADFAGWELKNTLDGHEAKFINKIVQEISLELRSINSGFDEKLVGMETRVEDVVSSLEVGIDEVRMIGIKGMGGAGKTTTSKAIFDHLSNHFEAKIFVENVREVSNGSMSSLKKLQEQVLSDVLNEQVTLESVHVGKNIMKRRMCGKKGSRILITTRDEQVLVAHRVNVIRDIVLLSKQDAIFLFSRYAFGRENPLQGYEGLSGKVVRYAAGLPLTLEVLGSFLCGKDKLEWVDAIDRLKRIPLKDTLEKLELSYISLEDEHKEIFLDIACILKGQTKDDAIRILECCGFHARNGLKVLE
ncbi:Toll/interleukin-1 receptor domain-containing protein [Tanacetum coccineum]